MRIRRVLVEGLFGLFRHDIHFHASERVTIIHGPNGFGKTIILRMLDGFLTAQFGIFARVPIDAFTVFFDGGLELRLERDHSATHLPSLRICSSAEPNQPFEFPAELISKHGAFRELSRVARVRMRRRGVELGQPDFAPGSIPAWLQDIHDTVHVKLIETQRLDVTDERRQDERRPTVVSHAGNLAHKMHEVLTRYAARSQELDRTFPARLLDGSAPVPRAGDLQDRLAALESKRKRLTALGFLDPEESIELPLSRDVEDKREVLAVYVGDMEKKLAVFDDMAAKMELFVGIVNDLFLYKRLRTDRNKGFVFTSEAGERISPDLLSAGEQHQLILLYELLFRSPPGSLVLIDEPELSLHVSWQERFVDDLMQMARLSDFDVLVATHSPEIISSHWDLVEQLRGPEATEDRRQSEPAT